MATPQLHVPRRPRPFTAFCLAAVLLSGCSFTQTSTSVRSLPDPPTQHVHLTRAGVIPVTGTFHQEAHSIVGQLAFTTDCTAESRQLVHRQQTTDTHPNRGTAAVITVLGGVATAVGAGFLVASGNADKHVYCGEGKAGDTCQSESSAAADLGLTLLLSGITTAVAGGYLWAQKPKVETTDLPSETHTQLLANNVSCGTTPALEGLSVALDVPGNGTWRGRTALDGSVRIEVSDSIKLPDGVTLSVVVDSVPPILAGIVSPGAVLGEVKLARGAASKKNARAKEQPRDPLATRW